MKLTPCLALGSELGAKLAMVCVVALASFALALPAYAAKVEVDLHQHPTGGKTPVDVSVGLYVTNLVAIDETRESFEVGAVLASFAFYFLCIFEITTVFLMQKAGMRDPAVKLHTAGKWAYPLAYFVVLLLLAIYFLA